MKFLRNFLGSEANVRWAGYAVIALSAVYVLWMSWFKWMNPQIDFGRELYTAWRITEGDLPVKDMFRQFGPLSDYWNALWFWVFGSSIRVLVFVNLAIYGVIVTLVYRMLRKAFGFLPAVVASSLGILIFGFGDYNGWGNYNYAAPYSHAATHGILLLVLLMTCLTQGMEKRSKWHGWVEGFILGLLCLTKIEFIFVGIVLAGLQMIRYACLRGWKELAKYLLEFAGSWLAVLLVTWGLFCTGLGWKDAAEAAWTGFMPFQSGAVTSAFQKKAIGNDELWYHLWLNFKALLGAGIGLGFLATWVRMLVEELPVKKWSGWIWAVMVAGIPFVIMVRGLPDHLSEVVELPATKVFFGDSWWTALLYAATAGLPVLSCALLRGKWKRWILPVVLTAAVLVSIQQDWPGVGRTFLWALIAGAIYWAFDIWRTNANGHWREGLEISDRTWVGLVLTVGGITMMARMVLFTRFYHYGFYQAMLAGVVAFAFLLRNVPLLAGKRIFARQVVWVCLLAMLVTGLWQIIGLTVFYYRYKTTTIGVWTDKKGKVHKEDSFNVMDPSMNPTGLGLWRTVEYLRENTPGSDTMVVMPEGVMLNYWLRRKNPTTEVSFMPDIIAGERGEKSLKQLMERMPNEVLVASRVNMAEFGVHHFGQDETSGKALLDWVERDYVQIGKIGQTPFEPLQFGVFIYKSKQTLEPWLKEREAAKAGAGTKQ